MRCFSTFALATFVACIHTSVAADSNGTTPMQLRVAYAGPTGMVVSWNTNSHLSNPTVRYGLSASALTQTASSNVSVTYATSLTYNNHVKITGLESNTLYFYQPDHSNLSTPLSFKTSRAAGDATPYSAALVVDLGLMGDEGLTTHVGKGAANPLGANETNTIQSLYAKSSQYEFLWHPGDIAYADYWLKEEIQGFLPNTSIAEGVKVYELLLNMFYEEMTPITSQIPYMVGPGNHEANCDNGGTTDKANNISYDVSICMPGQTNFTGYINHFRMPSAESHGTGNFWYSFDNGMAHFVQIDTETDLGHGIIGPDEPGGSAKENSGPFGSVQDAQLDWLAKDLQAVNRTKTPWIIVAGHRPWYISASNDSICETCRSSFEPLFLNYSVDLVLSGHVHAYERLAPISSTKADPNELNNPSAPWYITNGCGGHYDGLDTLVKPLRKYSRFAADTAYGWSKLTFHNCTHLTHEFVASANGTILDTATLFKNRTCKATRTSVNGTSGSNTTGVGGPRATIFVGSGVRFTDSLLGLICMFLATAYTALI